MNRVGGLSRGLGAVALLGTLVAAVPWALWHYIGWPLPHDLPTWAQLRSALSAQAIPDPVLLKTLACVVWTGWAVLAASVAGEAVASARGRAAPRVRAAGPFQPLAAHLVTAVVVAAATLGSRPTAPAHSPLAVILRPPPAATLTMRTATAAAPATAATPPAPTPPASNVPPPVTRAYTVQRSDTLWGIAEAQLGDPLRWSEIWTLNQGRAMGDGRTFDDPSLILPGWTLLMPAALTPITSPPAAPVAEPAPSPQTLPFAGDPPSPPAAPPRPAVAPGPTAPSPSPIPVPPAPAVPTTTSITDPPRHTTSGAPVELSSGSLVAGSFAAGVVSAIALGRLRRRHAYRYRPPQPGLDVGPPRLGPTLARLTHPAPGDDDNPEAEPADLQTEPVAWLVDPEPPQHPGQLEVATRDGRAVTVSLADLSGIALHGPGAENVARAWIAALLVGAGPGAAEIIMTGELAERLLPASSPPPAIRTVGTPELLIRALEAEAIGRTRRFERAETPDAATYRHSHPEDPEPLLVALVDTVPDTATRRWATLLANTARLDIAVLFLADCPAATGHIHVNADTVATDATPKPIGQLVTGARLFSLGAHEAVELLAALADSDAEAEADQPTAEASNGKQHTDQIDHDDSGSGRNGTDGPRPAARETAPSWPPAHAEQGPVAPVAVQLLGPYQVTAHGETVATGLRGRAKALLAWYLLHPEGATVDAAVDALWPDTPPERVYKRFWLALGDLRSRLRSPTQEPLEVLRKIGEHYQPHPAEIACDLWDFQHGLTSAARTCGNDTAALSALRGAVDAYTGELLAGTDYLWAEPARADLHRRALDAHLRLAELDDTAGRPDASVATLERAIHFDRYAEEPYRRLMALHARHDRLDAVAATWRLLQNRLGELDLEVEPATARLYRSIAASDPNRPDATRPPVRSSP